MELPVDVRDRSAPRRRTATRYRRLRLVNVAVGLGLAAEALYMLLASNGLALPVSAAFLGADPVTVRGPTVPERVWSVPIGPAVAVFLFLAAADHLLVAAPGVHRWYERGLDASVNYARWIEYALSASVMIVLIGLFVGVRDLAAVVAVFAVNTAMILFGLLMERGQQPGAADWTAYWFGCLVGVVPWAVVGTYLAKAPTVPGFVYAITLVQFVLFSCFAATMALQYARAGRWRDYLYGETTYIVLSVTAKSLLAWIVFVNVLRT